MIYIVMIRLMIRRSAKRELFKQALSVGDGPGNNWSGGTVNGINRLGSYLGHMSQSNGDEGPDRAPSQGDRITARRLGKRLAEITATWHGNEGYITERKKLL